MNEWDSAAATYLRDLVSQLRTAGVIELFEEQVPTVWRRNVDSFDRLLGDTNRSLGFTCHENLRELVVRACAGESSAWRQRGVTALAVDSSLRVDACGVRLGLMKAPPSTKRTPAWHGSDFAWGQDSEVRRAAAERNSVAYRPTASDQLNRQLVMSLEDAEAVDATRLRDVFLVWSGQLEPALTAGWLGLPSLEGPAWFAVEPLWWHEQPGQLQNKGSDDGPARGGNFADLPAPNPVIKLKNRHEATGGEES